MSTTLAPDDFEPPHLEFASDTAYLLSFIGNPNSYEIGAQFFTARMRWGVNRDDHSIFRGYNQVYLLGMVEPIFRGPENHYFGISTGFVTFSSARLAFATLRIGRDRPRWIDSHD